MLSGTGQAEQTQLADLHPGIQQDRQGCDIGQFQGHMPAEARIDEPRSGVGEESEAAETALAFQPTSDVVGKGDDLVGAREHELSGVKHELIAGIHLNEAREVRLLGRRIDVGVLVVLEDPKEFVQSHIHAGRLDHGGVEGFQGDAASVDFGLDIAVTEKHAMTLPSAGR